MKSSAESVDEIVAGRVGQLTVEELEKAFSLVARQLRALPTRTESSSS